MIQEVEEEAVLVKEAVEAEEERELCFHNLEAVYWMPYQFWFLLEKEPPWAWRGHWGTELGV